MTLTQAVIAIAQYLQANKIQDTGWRDITSLTQPPDGAQVSGRIFLRRIGNTVYFQMDDYYWSIRNSKQSFLPPEICAYTHPTETSAAKNRIMRAGLFISTGDRNAVPWTIDWLNKSNMRLINYVGVTGFGLAQWITDTPFPTEPLGEPI